MPPPLIIMTCIDWCGIECVNGYDCPRIDDRDFNCDECYYNEKGTCEHCYFEEDCMKGGINFEQRK